MKPVLEAKNISKVFGGLKALQDVDMEIRPGQIVALIGPNGAGKTTLFNCLTGLYQPSQGQVIIHPPQGSSREIQGLKPNQITELGLARTFQNIRLFSNMTVIENVMVGRHPRTSSNFLQAILKSPQFKREEQETLEISYDLLCLVGLAPLSNQLAKNLPYADQRRLEIARALATDPFLLLLDEPAAGMNPQETAQLDELIVKIRREKDLSILLIEHDMKLVMNISDHIFVMNQGERIAAGNPREIQNDPAVIRAYLGEEAHA